jgi:hypothetical protein
MIVFRQRVVTRLAVLLTLVASCGASAEPARTFASSNEAAWTLWSQPVHAAAATLDPGRRRLYLLTRDAGADQPLLVWSTDVDGTGDWQLLQTQEFAPVLDVPRFVTSMFDPERNRWLVWWVDDIDFHRTNAFALSLDTLVWTDLGRDVAGGASAGRSYALDPFSNDLYAFGSVSFVGLDNPHSYFGSDPARLDLNPTPHWTDLSEGLPFEDPHPGGRGWPSLVFDGRRNRLLVMGGEYEVSYPPSRIGGFVDVWALDDTRTPPWRQLPLSGSPSVPLDHAHVVVDTTLDRVLLWGSGVYWRGPVSQMLLSDTSIAVWSPVPTHGTWPAESEAEVLDPVRRAVQMFAAGGRSELTLDAEPEIRTLVPALSTDSPTEAGEPVPDEVRDRLLFVGSSQLWARNIEMHPSWTRLPCTGSRRPASALAVDTRRDRIISFGGHISGGPAGSPVSDSLLMVLPRTGGAWTPLVTTGPVPPARERATMVYDSVADRVLLYGGEFHDRPAAPLLSAFRNDLWALSLSDATPAWVRLDTVRGRPDPRSGASVFIDAPRNRLLVWGGFGYSDAVIHAFHFDTAAWDTLPVPSNPDWWGIVSLDPTRRRLIAASVQSEYYFGGVAAPQIFTLSLDDPTAWQPLATKQIGPAAKRFELQGYFDAAHDRWVVFNMVQDSRRPGLERGDLWTLAMPLPAPLPNAVLVSASADTGAAHLVWNVGRGTAVEIRAERREDAGEWTALGPCSADNDGLVHVDDPSIRAGHHYDYRLWFSNGVTSATSSEASLAPAPRPAAIAAIAVPNPAVGSLSIAATLPAGTSEARLDVFDLGGRRVLGRALSGVPGTVQAVSFGALLRPGVYVVRLSAGGRQLASRRLVMLR